MLIRLFRRLVCCIWRHRWINIRDRTDEYETVCQRCGKPHP